MLENRLLGFQPCIDIYDKRYNLDFDLNSNNFEEFPYKIIIKKCIICLLVPTRNRNAQWNIVVSKINRRDRRGYWLKTFYDYTSIIKILKYFHDGVTRHWWPIGCRVICSKYFDESKVARELTSGHIHFFLMYIMVFFFLKNQEREKELFKHYFLSMFKTNI